MPSIFPRWLADQVKIERPFPALVANGMSLLVEAALPGGIGQRVKTSEGDDGVRVRKVGLESRLLNLPARLGVGQSDLATSHKRFATSMASLLLQPGPNMSVLAMEPPTSADVSKYVKSVLSGLKRLSKTAAGESRRAAAVTQETCPHRTPFVMLQASYQALAANRSRAGASESDAHAMAMFGLAGCARPAEPANPVQAFRDPQGHRQATPLRLLPEPRELPIHRLNQVGELVCVFVTAWEEVPPGSLFASLQ